MVDAASPIENSMKQEAEFLYELLLTGRQILVACNKTEMFTALPVKKLKGMLQVALEEHRCSKNAALNKISLEGSNVAESEAEEPLILDELPITFIVGSVTGDQINEWLKWIEFC